MIRILRAPFTWILDRWNAADTRLATFYADLGRKDDSDV